MRPLSLLRPSAGCPARQGTGGLTGLWREPAAVVPHRMMMAPLADPSTLPVITVAGSRRGERVVAELGQQVARPADDLAGLGQGGALAALAVLHRRVVAVIGGAGPGVGLPGLVHAPAQH